MRTVEVPEWAARLAAEFLEAYSERLGSDGCNDYDVPEWVPMPELLAAMRAADPNDEDIDESCAGYNFIVVGAVVHALMARPERAERSE